MGCVPAHLRRARRSDAHRVVPHRRSEAGDLPVSWRRRAHVSRCRRIRRIDRDARSQLPLASAHDRGGRRGIRRRRRVSVRGWRDALSAVEARRHGRRRRSRRWQACRAGAASDQSFARPDGTRLRSLRSADARDLAAARRCDARSHRLLTDAPLDAAPRRHRTPHRARRHRRARQSQRGGRTACSASSHRAASRA